jgi:hypothetical protein
MNTPIKLSVSSILLAGILTGCSQQQIQLNDTDRRILNDAQTSVLKVKRSPSKIYNKQRRANKSSKKSGSQHNIGLPPAKAGQCYAKVKKPASYKTIMKRVLTQKATTNRMFLRGPQYRWVNKKVLVRPVSYVRRVIPAVYKTVTKRVMVKPSYLTWKKGKGKVTRIDNMTGEVLCRVRIPAVYKNVHRKVLVRAAQTVKRPRPAVYRTVKQKKLVSPAQYQTVNTPARYTKKRYRVKTASAKYIWRQVACKTTVSQNQTRKVKYQKRKLYKAQGKKSTTYVKKYSQKRHIMQPKLSAQRLRQDRKLRELSNARKKLAKQRVHARYKTVLTDEELLSYAQAVFATKDNINTYKPSRMKEVYRQAQRDANIGSNSQSKLVHSKTVNNRAKVNKPTVRLTKQNAVLRIQTALSQRGFNPGGIDGKLGPATVAALTAFQRQNGLAIGKLNRATLSALRLI